MPCFDYLPILIKKFDRKSTVNEAVTRNKISGLSALTRFVSNSKPQKVDYEIDIYRVEKVNECFDHLLLDVGDDEGELREAGG